jgi:nucleotide-binding universal stress UspA family protein
MSGFKSLLVCLNQQDNSSEFLSSCYDFANKFKSHLEVLHVKADPVSAVPYMGSNFPVEIMKEMVELAEKENIKKLENLQKAFEQFAKENDVIITSDPNEVINNKNSVSAFWNSQTGSEAEIAASISRYKSAALHPKPIEDDEHSNSWTIDSVLTEGGAPVIILPKTSPKTMGQHIGIFWSSTPEVSRALKHSNKLLTEARKITIITPDFEQNVFEANGLKASLKRQRLDAEIVTFSSTLNEGEKILQIAKENDVDMLISGAYTNNHLRRLILGGITKHLVYNTEIPLLLAR